MLCPDSSSSIWESNGRTQSSRWKQTSAHTLEKSSFLRRASLLWNLDKANSIGSPTLVPYLSLHQFHPYRRLLIPLRIPCCKKQSPMQSPYRTSFFFSLDCSLAAVFCCISPKSVNRGGIIDKFSYFCYYTFDNQMKRIRLPDEFSLSLGTDCWYTVPLVFSVHNF